MHCHSDKYIVYLNHFRSVNVTGAKDGLLECFLGKVQTYQRSEILRQCKNIYLCLNNVGKEESQY